MVKAAAKAGSVGVIGVYPPTFAAFPIGEMMNRNLTVQGGIDPTEFITQLTDPMSMVDAYEQFDTRQQGWLKTVVPVA